MLSLILNISRPRRPRAYPSSRPSLPSPDVLDHPTLQRYAIDLAVQVNLNSRYKTLDTPKMKRTENLNCSIFSSLTSAVTLLRRIAPRSIKNAPKKNSLWQKKERHPTEIFTLFMVLQHHCSYHDYQSTTALYVSSHIYSLLSLAIYCKQVSSLFPKLHAGACLEPKKTAVDWIGDTCIPIFQDA